MTATRQGSREIVKSWTSCATEAFVGEFNGEQDMQEHVGKTVEDDPCCGDGNTLNWADLTEQERKSDQNAETFDD